MRKDSTDRRIWAAKLHGKSRKRATKAAKQADKCAFRQELGEYL